ncbi:MAG: class I SAM-dependent methyltransferase [Gammaproteobacteria bacterium]
MKRYQERVCSTYFYAGVDATFYDETVRMTDRAYDLVHDVLTRVLGFWLTQRRRHEAPNAPVWILDIGCGTGAEAMRILCRVPCSRLLCVDHSPLMLSRFREKVVRAYGNETADGRLALADVDFRETAWLDRARAKCALDGLSTQFDAAVSVYALHHLAAEAKLDVYRSIGAHLQADSIFVNADLYAFGTPWLDRLAQEEEEDWVLRQFDLQFTNADHLHALLGPSRTRLKEAWVAHIRNENSPLPIVPLYGVPEHLRGTTSEECLLREAGFAGVEVPARHFQSAVLVASK